MRSPASGAQPQPLSAQHTQQGLFDRDIGTVSPGDGFQKVYIHLSPLTLWKVEIPRVGVNTDVDFTGVTSMSLFFSGSVIPTSSNGLAALAGVRPIACSFHIALTTPGLAPAVRCGHKPTRAIAAQRHACFLLTRGSLPCLQPLPPTASCPKGACADEQAKHACVSSTLRASHS